jgi:hypothetical protein
VTSCRDMLAHIGGREGAAAAPSDRRGGMITSADVREVAGAMTKRTPLMLLLGQMLTSIEWWCRVTFLEKI